MVVPAIAFNSHLDAAIHSLLEQSYSNFEVIVVLDGVGLDSSRTWTTDSRVRFVCHETRQGTPVALNAGIREAGGEYIARLDADDVSFPSRIARQVDYLVAHPDTGCVGTVSAS